jgi:murein hydrolase activator
MIPTVVIALIVIVLCGHSRGAPHPKVGEVVVNRLNLRAAPHLGSAILAVLERGRRVKILQLHDGWYTVDVGTRRGYIRALEKYVRPVTETDLQVADPVLAGGEPAEEIGTNGDHLGRKIEDHRTALAGFTRQETELVQSLSTLDREAIQARQRVVRIKSELTVLESKITATTPKLQTSQRNLKEGETHAGQRVVALYKLNWLGKMEVLAAAQSMNDFFQRGAILKRIVVHDLSLLENLRQERERLRQILGLLEDHLREKRALEAEFDLQVEKVIQKSAQRSKLLKQIRTRKSLELAAIESLKQAAAELNDKMGGLSADQPPADETAGSADPTFAALKGLLKWPVAGTIAYFRGPFKKKEDRPEGFRTGIVIKADRGEPVHALYSGRVLYSDWFRGYGNMVIIDHGDSFYSVYAHMEERFRETGDRVETREVIATVGNSGAMSGPQLYFEIRHHSNPLDPMQWIKQG